MRSLYSLSPRLLTACCNSIFMLLLLLSSPPAAAQPAGDDLALSGQWRSLSPAGASPSLAWQSFDPGQRTVLARRPHGAQLQVWPQREQWPEPPFVLVVRDLGLNSISLHHPDSGDWVHASPLSPSGSGWVGAGRVAYVITQAIPAGTKLDLLLPADANFESPPRFELQAMATFQHQQSAWAAFAGASFAVMVAMALIALAFGLFLRDRTFVIYTGYVLSYALVQAIQTGFVAHPLGWDWLAASPQLFGRAAIAASVVLACLFADHFMQLKRYAPGWRRAVLALAVAVSVAAALRFLPGAALDRFSLVLINPLLMLGGPLLLLVAFVSALRGSRYAWFFLIGWLPLLILTVLSSAQSGGALATWHWLENAGLAAGAFEALVLSLGLADRTLQVRRERDQVRELADIDGLTGVSNHRHIHEQLAVLVNSARHHKRPLALMFIDMDHFKRLNDRYGHPVGDRVLRVSAASMLAQLRGRDLIGRYGGEEFLVAMPDMEQAAALRVAERLRATIATLDMSEFGMRENLTISIGLALYLGDETIGQLIARADAAMYQAKAQGRNRVVLV